LRWAWNLRATGDKAFVRVWGRSVTCYLVPGSQPSEPESMDEVIAALLRSAGDRQEAIGDGSLRATALQRLFNVSSGHVLNLLSAGELKLAPRSVCRVGPGGSPEITRESVVELLKARSF